MITANGTYGPTNTTIFSTTFGNYSTNAVGYDAIRASKIGIKKQRERGTAEDKGTATGGSTVTLQDTSKSWTTNQYAGRYVRLVYNQGAGQTSLIASNTADTLTFATLLTTAPAAGTLYEISASTKNDEKIGLIGRFIIHGDDTEPALQSFIENSPQRPDTAEREENEHYKKYKLINSPYFDGTSAYYWLMIIDKLQGETIEIGYVDDQREPTLLLQDQPNIGNVFTQDEIRWKVRFEYGLTIVENKGMYLNAATSV